MLPENGHLLRIFVGESDKHQGKPLYQWIVQEAKKQGLAGATVLRGVEGYGAHSAIHSAKLLELSTAMPMIIEIVDDLEKIETFLQLIDGAITEGLATVEKVHIRLYRSGKSK